MATNASLEARGMSEQQRQRYWELREQIDIILAADATNVAFASLKTKLDAL